MARWKRRWCWLTTLRINVLLKVRFDCHPTTETTHFEPCVRTVRFRPRQVRVSNTLQELKSKQIRLAITSKEKREHRKQRQDTPVNAGARHLACTKTVQVPHPCLRHGPCRQRGLPLITTVQITVLGRSDFQSGKPTVNRFATSM